MQEGYDHSYYFIATFIEDHINFHAKALVGDAEAAVEAVLKEHGLRVAKICMRKSTAYIWRMQD